MENSTFPSKLVIVRHAESERNLERDRIEQYNSNQLMLSTPKRDPDVRLTRRGISQAEITGKALGEEFGSFDIAFVSPYIRTQQTAKIILEGIQQKYPEEYERKEREGKYYYRSPGGESYPDVGLRLYNFLSSMIRSASNKNALVVTHSVVVKMFRKTLEKLTEQYVLKIDAENEPKNCGVTCYLLNPDTGKLKLKYYNKVFYKI